MISMNCEQQQKSYHVSWWILKFKLWEVMGFHTL